MYDIDVMNRRVRVWDCCRVMALRECGNVVVLFDDRDVGVIVCGMLQYQALGTVHGGSAQCW